MNKKKAKEELWGDPRSILKRQEGEGDLQYHKRILTAKLVDKTLDMGYDELAPYLYGKSYAPDVARRMAYGSIRTLGILDEQKEQQIKDGGVLEDIRRSKRELAKERIKLQTEKLEYNRWLREDAREELFVEQIIDAIERHVDNTVQPKKLPIKKNKKEGVLCIADAHFGKEFTIYGLRDEVINTYSPEIFFDAMDRIYTETLETVRREGLTSIRVFNLGDSVDGFLRNSQIWTLRYGVVDSAIIYGNYLGEWLKKLSENVRVVYGQTDGNHDELRLLDGRKGAHLHESAGKIILNSIKIINKNNPNFEVRENKVGFIFDEVCGFNVLGVHGEYKDAASAIKDYSEIYGITISYLIAGHKHHSAFVNSGVGKGCIGVGSIVGSDDFSMRLRRSADASATFIVLEEGKGKVAEYTYILNEGRVK